ncbi:cytochrome c oxidase assembly protein COX18, mitochondrial isoform X2 [Anabrus simplex]|uniref:cytochrome c oxidase assembly protein COX18, mitochondrial isoform X2 n=1 Tax=Anabrus simplex TaxID=316456 RepID=UPI0035A32AF2
MSQYHLLRRCSEMVSPSGFINDFQSVYRRVYNLDYNKFRLGFRLGTKSPIINISNLEMKLVPRRHWTFCKYSSEASSQMIACSSEQVYDRKKCNRSVLHLLSQNVATKPLLLGFDRRNISFCQARCFSYEPAIGTPIQAEGVYKLFSESAPVLKTQELLLHFHDISGLPWWATIIVSTVVLRTVVTLPLAIYQYYILAKVENLTVEMSAIVQELKKETAIAIKKFNWTPKEARITYNRSLRKQWSKLVVRENCHPAKASILLLVQLPMWICLSFALRNLVYMLPHQDTAAQLTCLELSVSKFLWIPNLITPDASWILPVILGLTNLAIIECLNLYWATSSAYGLIQNIFLMSPRVKRICGIPRTPSTQDKPYQHIASQLKNKTAGLFEWSKEKR